MTLDVNALVMGDMRALGAFGRLGDREALEMYRRVGQKAAEIIRIELVATYKDGKEPNLAPLHWFTQQEKGNAKPLHHTGGLANSVEVVVAARGSMIEYYVGFSNPEDARRATYLEEGATFEVTEKMRRYLAWKGLYLKSTTRFLRMPARPIFAGVISRSIPEIRSMVRMEFEKEVKALRTKGGVAGFFSGLGSTLKSWFGRR
jgi:hypothetical protein